MRWLVTSILELLASRTLWLERLAADAIGTAGTAESRLEQLPAEVADLERHRELLAVQLTRVGGEADQLAARARADLGRKLEAIRRLEHLVREARGG